MAKRRGHGEGSIYRQRDDLWAAALTVNGKRRYFYGKTKGGRWHLAVATGLRRGATLGLSWDDVDLHDGELLVRRALQRNRGKVRIGHRHTHRPV